MIPGRKMLIGRTKAKAQVREQTVQGTKEPWRNSLNVKEISDFHVLGATLGKCFNRVTKHDGCLEDYQ